MNVSKPPFSRLGDIPVDRDRLGVHGIAVEVRERRAVGPDLDDPTLVHRDHGGRPPQHGRDVGGEDRLAVADARPRAARRPSRRPGARVPPTTARRASTRPRAPGRCSAPPPPRIRRRGAAPRPGGRRSSVSVSDVRVCPSFSSRARSCWKFSMIPLWITATVPEQSTWGWAFRSVGRAVRRPARVAHRDVAGRMPVRRSSAASSSASFPARLTTVRPPSSTATPAESYPRYSRRRSPSRTIGRASSGPT